MKSITVWNRNWQAHIEASFAWDKVLRNTDEDIARTDSSGTMALGFQVATRRFFPHRRNSEFFVWIGSCHASPSGCIQSIGKEWIYGRCSDAGHFSKAKHRNISAWIWMLKERLRRIPENNCSGMVGESEENGRRSEIREFIYVRSKPWSYKEGLIGAGLR